MARTVSSQPRRGERAAHAAKKVKAHPSGRRCEVCEVPLSVYNPNRVCWQHVPPSR